VRSALVDASLSKHVIGLREDLRAGECQSSAATAIAEAWKSRRVMIAVTVRANVYVNFHLCYLPPAMWLVPIKIEGEDAIADVGARRGKLLWAQYHPAGPAAFGRFVAQCERRGVSEEEARDALDAALEKEERATRQREACAAAQELGAALVELLEETFKTWLEKTPGVLAAVYRNTMCVIAELREVEGSAWSCSDMHHSIAGTFLIRAGFDYVHRRGWCGPDYVWADVDWAGIHPFWELQRQRSRPYHSYVFGFTSTPTLGDWKTREAFARDFTSLFFKHVSLLSDDGSDSFWRHDLLTCLRDDLIRVGAGKNYEHVDVVYEILNGEWLGDLVVSKRSVQTIELRTIELQTSHRSFEASTHFSQRQGIRASSGSRSSTHAGGLQQGVPALRLEDQQQQPKDRAQGGAGAVRLPRERHAPCAGLQAILLSYRALA
jgi:hypothetical protein